MKPILHALTFGCIGLIIVGPILNLIVPEFLYSALPNRQIVLESQKTNISFDQVILGDSVGHQVFIIDPHSFRLLTTQSISVFGQYQILKNVLKANPKKIRHAILAYIPHSFSNDLDQPYTFRDVVKSFIWPSNFAEISPIVVEKLTRKPLFYLGLFSIFKVNNFLNFDYSQYFLGADKYVEPFSQYKPIMSDVSVEYLKQMARLCKEEGVELHILPNPISDKGNLDFTDMKARIHGEGLDPMFTNYFEALLILPNSYFLDGLHLQSEHYRLALDHIQKFMPK